MNACMQYGSRDERRWPASSQPGLCINLRRLLLLEELVFATRRLAAAHLSARVSKIQQPEMRHQEFFLLFTNHNSPFEFFL